MFKNIIAPAQAWLLSQGQCVGCGMPLSGATSHAQHNGSEVVICKCGRGYVRVSGKRYRRAKQSEMSA